MNISITPELEQFVQSKVQSGMYQSASELFREALRLLAERDLLKKKRIDAMDAFIAQGMGDGAQSDFQDGDTIWAELDALIAAAESHKHA